MIEFLRIGLGVGYRLVAGGFQEFTIWDLSSPTLTLQFRFGGF